MIRRAAAAAVAALAGVALVAVPSEASAQPGSWDATQADVAAAQAPGRAGAGVVVAVVDTWIDPTVSVGGVGQFAGRVAPGAHCVGGSGSCSGGAVPDGCTHGTHVAGTVASVSYGVAPAATILPVQVLSDPSGGGQCSGSTNDVAAGIGWAVSHGAQVINMSLGDQVPGLTQSSAVTAAVQAAASAGVVVVIAAGNHTAPITDQYGTVGGAEAAVLVAATGPGGSLAYYSERGGSVSLAAPGGDDGSAGVGGCSPSTCITSTVPGNAVALMEGTSMATPHVAGVAALLLAQAPGRGRADVIGTMESTAGPVAGGGAGAGLLDAGAALRRRSTAPAAAGPATSTPASRPTATARPGPSSSPTPSAPSSQPGPVAAPGRAAAGPGTPPGPGAAVPGVAVPGVAVPGLAVPGVAVVPGPLPPVATPGPGTAGAGGDATVAVPAPVALGSLTAGRPGARPGSAATSGGVPTALAVLGCLAVAAAGAATLRKVRRR